MASRAATVCLCLCVAGLFAEVVKADAMSRTLLQAGYYTASPPAGAYGGSPTPGGYTMSPAPGGPNGTSNGTSPKPSPPAPTPGSAAGLSASTTLCWTVSAMVLGFLYRAL